VYLLDTNYCSLIIQGQQKLRDRLDELDDVLLATCVIVRGELIFMAQKSEQKAGNLARVQSFLEGILMYPVDDQTADIYGQFKAEIIEHLGPRERSRRRKATIQELGISDNDLWIASVALQHSLTIVSADSDFSRMKEVRTFPWETW
jgi:tRNA(fMet)-specific endonuclease VapC